MRSIELFFSYSHEDEQLREELLKHLSLLKRERVIAGWNDREISAGQEWDEAIRPQLRDGPPYGTLVHMIKEKIPELQKLVLLLQ